MVTVGTTALEDSSRVDFARLRADRRERVLVAMAEHDLDVLLLGREPNAQYVSGARRLHLAGTRPFGPGCVVVRDGNEVHLLNNWDEGIPPEIPREHLFGIKWNPLNLVASLQKIAGLASAKRIGVDSMSPLFLQLIPMAAPDAQIVSAASALRSVRMRKTNDELACIRTAVAVAEASLAQVMEELRPGVSGKALLGAFEGHMTGFGVTTPATEGTFGAAAPVESGHGPRLARLTTARTIDEGALVALSGSVLYAGYEGGVGRTRVCGGHRGIATSDGVRSLFRRSAELRDRVLDACRPGASGEDLATAYTAAGDPLPGFPIAYRVGLGYEGAIAGSALGTSFDATQRLVPSMALGIETYVADDDGHGCLMLDTVQVTDDGCERLSTMSCGAGGVEEFRHGR